MPNGGPIIPDMDGGHYAHTGEPFYSYGPFPPDGVDSIEDRISTIRLRIRDIQLELQGLRKELKKLRQEAALLKKASSASRDK